MEEPPFGYRSPDDEPLFKARPTDPAVQVDLVSPAVEGYFRIPAIWAGDAPASEAAVALSPTVHHAVVFRKKLTCGVEVRVQRDGTFLFDFSSWSLAPLVVIPGYRRPVSEVCRVPEESSRAEEKAEQHAIFRAKVMNVHQACLSTSEYLIKRRTAAMGFPVTAWNTLKAISFDAANLYHDDAEDVHALARNVLNNKDHVVRQKPLGRRSVEISVIEHSFDLLDEILNRRDTLLIDLIETAYISACRQREKRFGEAVTLGWGVCEQLISLAWNDLIASAAAKGDEKASRMPKKRREKLSGRDYTASVMVEVLELSERISWDLYRELEIARKARNSWAHDMKVPSEREAWVCILAAETLLNQIKGVRLAFRSTGRSGVPQWPYWMWAQVQTSGGP